MDENYNLAQENEEDLDFGLTPEQEEKLFSDPAVQNLLSQVFGMKPNQEQENPEVVPKGPKDSHKRLNRSHSLVELKTGEIVGVYPEELKELQKAGLLAD